MLSCISASVLSARAGADRVNIMQAAIAAEAARRARSFRFMYKFLLQEIFTGGMLLA